jgi:tetratricopeptide (TPR) repeat protein
VYIQRGKLKEALILLERVAEGYRKLGTDTNIETHVRYETEMNVERRVLYQLGLDFRNRNFHDEAVNVLERAFESYSKALGSLLMRFAAIIKR